MAGGRDAPELYGRHTLEVAPGDGHLGTSSGRPKRRGNRRDGRRKEGELVHTTQGARPRRGGHGDSDRTHPTGESAVINVAEFTLKAVALVVPKRTDDAPVKLVPVILTALPPARRRCSGDPRDCGRIGADGLSDVGTARQLSRTGRPAERRGHGVSACGQHHRGGVGGERGHAGLERDRLSKLGATDREGDRSSRLARITDGDGGGKRHGLAVAAPAGCELDRVVVVDLCSAAR